MTVLDQLMRAAWFCVPKTQRRTHGEEYGLVNELVKPDGTGEREPTSTACESRPASRHVRARSLIEFVPADAICCSCGAASDEVQVI